MQINNLWAISPKCTLSNEVHLCHMLQALRDQCHPLLEAISRCKAASFLGHLMWVPLIRLTLGATNLALMQRSVDICESWALELEIISMQSVRRCGKQLLFLCVVV